MTTTKQLGSQIRAAALGLTLAIAGAFAAGAAPAEAAPHHDITFFDAGFSDYQAGGHPDATTTFTLGTEAAPNGTGFAVIKGGALRDAVVDLPPGLAGSPRSIPYCTTKQMGEFFNCPTESQVGMARIKLLGLSPPVPGIPGEGDSWPIVNVPPERGEVAKLGMQVIAFNTYVSIKVTRSGDYHVVAESANIYDGTPISAAELTIWGVPFASIHDPERFCDRRNREQGSTTDFGCAAQLPSKAFFTAPADCSVERNARLRVRSYMFSTDNDWTEAQSTPHGVTGCNQLDFSPKIEARPTTNLADSPTGLDVNLHIPQNDDPNGLAEAHLKSAAVTLPAGLTVNASSGDGLGACAPAQIGLATPVGQPDAEFNGVKAACPDASKLGTVEVETPVIDHPLKGAVYLASQSQNPFNSLLALYIAVEDPETGILIKLAGKVTPDPSTGQLTAVFDENPQLPFEEFRLHFFEGPRASLQTPVACGTFETTTTMVPWTAPEGTKATPSDSFEISRGAGGSGCLKSESEAPNSPAFSAGTIDPTAAVYSPFVLRLARADGTQRIKGIDTTLPQGLLGKLAGTSYCSDASLAVAAAKSGHSERANPSCPASSEVGSVDVGAGAGSTPLHVGGKAYLAGPYKGAPLSLAIVTPAVAGPFDLGTVVVRAALQVNPETAQIHAVSDPIPTILQGIPLDVRSIALRMDRPSFTLNPTSCNPMSVAATATSLLGQSATLSSPFQVGGCPALGFKPKLSLSLKGGTKRGKYPALKAVLTAKPGQANIDRVSVALPHSEFLAQEHIRTICTRVQYAADQCPAASVYGFARAVTPLLDQPLEGPVYLRSSSNLLPDLVVALHGQIDIDLVGRVDSVREGIRNTFELVPDAPVSRFVLEMQGGKKGLLVNSRNICKSTSKATVLIEGQNGKTADQTPVLTNGCKKARKGKKGKKGKGKSHKQRNAQR